MKSMLKQVVALSLLLSVPAVFAGDKATGDSVAPMYKRAGAAMKRGLVAGKNAAVKAGSATKNATVRFGSAAKAKAVAAGSYALNTKAGKFVWNAKDSRTKRAAKVAGAVALTAAGAVAVNKAYKRFMPAVVQNSSFNPVNWPSMAYNKVKRLVSGKKTVEPKKHVAQVDAAVLKQIEDDRKLALQLQSEEDEKFARTLQAQEDAQQVSAPAITLEVVAPKAPVAPKVQPAVMRAQRRNAAQNNPKAALNAARNARRGCAGGMCPRPR